MKYFIMLALVLVGGSFARPVFASPADYVYTPTVEYGERELDVKYGTATPVAGSGAEAVSLGMGYGVTEYWFTEMYLKREQSGGQNINLAEWENKFQLTETGKYFADLGFISEIEAPLSGNAPWELRGGPLLQKESGKWQVNANLLLVRAFGRPDESGVPYTTNLAYQWQVKYRWQRALEWGFQGMGELGTWDNWSKAAEQNHRMGPAIFGKFSAANRQTIKYNAAWLVGASPAAPNHTLRLQLEYEF